MNSQQAGFLTSVAVHLIVLVMFGAGMSNKQNVGRRVHMDFGIMDTAKSGPAMNKSISRKKAARKIKRKTEPQHQVKEPEPSVVEARASDPVTPEDTLREEIAADGQATAGAGEHGAKGRDLSYIKELLQRNLKYPAAARRNGWEGRVVVEFTITCTGDVSNIRVVESSGRALLDRSAVEVVNNSAPFSSHDKEMRVVIPIVYMLWSRDT